jgi:hypothetical protein
MAANIKDIEERLRRIEEVGEYFKETGLSTRQIAEYFSNNSFPISNKTVCIYIKKYMELHKEYQEKIMELTSNNKEKTIADKTVKIRIFNASKLVLEGYSIREIADILETTPKIIERDLSKRLKLLALEDKNINQIYKLVLINLNQHKINALNEYRNR